jgi:hypothetical protein
MNRLLQSLDKLPVLTRLLNWSRAKIPAQRGLILLGAIALTLLSLLLHLLWFMTGSAFLGFLSTVVLHVALITGFLGVLLAEAFGRAYRD